MELTQLQYFRVVAATKNMTRAAEQLHLTQPALSRTIGRLEEDLGVKLFIRAGNRINLSHEGRVFLFRVEQFLSELEDGVKEVRDMSTVERGHVNFVTASVDLLEEFMLDYFSVYPELQVFFRVSHSEELETKIEERICDFAIMDEQPASPRLQWKRLLEEPYLLLVSREHPLAKQKSIELAETEKERFIISNAFVTMGTYGDTVTRFCRRAGFDPEVSFKGTSTDIVYQFVARNRGVMMLPASLWYCSRNPALSNARSQIAALEISYPVCRREIGVCTLRGGFLSNAAQAVLAAMEEYYEAVEAKMHERWGQ